MGHTTLKCMIMQTKNCILFITFIPVRQNNDLRVIFTSSAIHSSVLMPFINVADFSAGVCSLQSLTTVILTLSFHFLTLFTVILQYCATSTSLLHYHHRNLSAYVQTSHFDELLCSFYCKSAGVLEKTDHTFSGKTDQLKLEFIPSM